MSHSERLPECEEFQCNMKSAIDEHFKESVPVRRDVDRHNDQITTLMQANGSVMQDIKDIKDNLVRIERMIYTGAIGVLMIVAGEAMYFGGYLKQIDINTGRLNEIERILPRSAVIGNVK